MTPAVNDLDSAALNGWTKNGFGALVRHVRTLEARGIVRYLPRAALGGVSALRAELRGQHIYLVAEELGRIERLQSLRALLGAATQ